MKVLLGLKKFDVFGLAKTFLNEAEVSMIVYDWHGIEMVGSRLVEVWQCWYIRVWNRE